MTRISALFSKFWRNIHISIVILFTAILIFKPDPITNYLSQALIGSLYYPFFQIKTAVADLAGVKAENERLQKTLLDASMQIGRLEEVQRENQRLRQILGFEPPVAHELVPAKVISVSGEPVPIVAKINRGATDSIHLHNAIINEQGLVGRIIAVSRDFATVQLLTDPTNRVAARVGRTREMGIARYVAGKGMMLANFPVQGKISEGDQIISSGFGGIYPPGLIIGTVRSVTRPKEQPFCVIQVDPVTNFNSLEELFILRPLAL